MADPVSDDKLMGRNEYARHRGVAPNAVSKAINSGRIKAAVVFDAGGAFAGIHWQQADALWSQNTDVDQAARAGAPFLHPLHVEPAAPLFAGTAQDAPGEAAPIVKDGEQARYLEARARTQEFTAKQAELDYLKNIGRLVSVDELQTVASRRYSVIRDKILNIGTRSGIIAAELGIPEKAHLVDSILHREHTQALNGLADDASAEVARGAAERVAA